MEETTELSIVERVLRIRQQMGLDASLSAQSLTTLMTEFAVDGSTSELKRGDRPKRVEPDMQREWSQWAEFGDYARWDPGD